MSEFELKQSGEKRTFTSGAQRDSKKNKTRPDLISPIFLERFGDLMAKGAEHYGERNWEKGMPLSEYLACAFRHFLKVLRGIEDEDHIIQCAFNLMAFVHTQQLIRDGSLPMELDDAPKKKTLESALTSDKKSTRLECDLCLTRFDGPSTCRNLCSRCALIVQRDLKLENDNA